MAPKEEEEEEEEEKEPLVEQAELSPGEPKCQWRNGAAFWLLGLANNLPYVIMLSAARDLMAPPGHRGELLGWGRTGPASFPSAANGNSSSSRYDCNPTSTGAVLLADILPTLLIKMAAPFGLYLLPIRWRVMCSALCAWGSFSLVALARGVAASLSGVALASVASGLGELTFLALAAEYPSIGLSYWSSGTGAAGVGGALGYGALRGAMGLSQALLPWLLLPHITLLSYCFLLGPSPALATPPPSLATPTVDHPPLTTPSLDQPPSALPSLVQPPSALPSLVQPPSALPSLVQPSPLAPPTPSSAPMTTQEKWRLGKWVLGHVTPLGIVYFAEYFSNQGLLELLYFPNSSLSHNEQYRWSQLLYQLGVFLSRSSSSCLRVHRVWLLALLQVLNALLLLAAVAVPLLPGLAVAMVLVLWEGLVGGGAYVNTFLNIAQQVEPRGRGLAMSVSSLADTVGVALAGGVALAAHSYFCSK